MKIRPAIGPRSASTWQPRESSAIVLESNRTHYRETGSKGVTNIPFTKDRSFVERPTVLLDLKEKIRSKPHGCSWVALVGLAGTGKSQLAIEQGYQWIQGNRNAAVFWVYASTYISFREGFAEIARMLELPGREDPKQNVLEIVYNWLKTTDREWKIILDNADEVIREPSLPGSPWSNRKLSDYIPQVEHGTLLVTSRNLEAASNIIGGHASIVKVPAMSEDECLKLLRRTLPEGPSKDETDLITSLQRLPLAITQAASYIVHSPFMSTSSYVRDFRSIEKRSALLNHNEGDLRRRQDVPNAVVSTLELSFNQIAKQYPKSYALLSLMSCFDWQQVPESLLTHDPDIYSREAFSFSDVMLPLMDFSLVTMDLDERLYSMHPLVWIAARAWLDLRAQTPIWIETALANLSSIFPWPYSNDARSTCRRFLPHCEQIVTHHSVNESFGHDAAFLNWKCGVYLTGTGIFAQAPAYYKRAFEALAKLNGREQQETLSCYMGLGSAYRDLGEYKQSRQILEDVFRAATNVLGREDDLTLEASKLLATTWSLLGDQKKAIKLLEDVYETHKRLFGAGNVETAKSAVSLSSVYGKLDPRKSRNLEEKSLRVIQNHYGPEHPETVRCKYNLAQTYMSLGAYGKAVELLHQVEDIRRAIHGEDHPEVLNTQATLATVYDEMGNHIESLELSQATFEKLARVLGPSHPDTLRTQESLGLQLESMGQHQRAKEELEATYKLRKERLGKGHPDTLHTLANLALTYHSMGEADEAMKVAQQALSKQEKARLPEHSDVLENMANIAGFHYQKGEFASAAALEEEVSNRRERHYGAEHPDTIRSLANLSLTYYALKREREAIDLHRRAFELAEALLGPEGSETIAYSEQLRKWTHSEAGPSA